MAHLWWCTQTRDTRRGHITRLELKGDFLSITGLHIPHGDSPVIAVTVNERNAMSYYPYVNGGPVEAGHLSLGGLELAIYVNSHYADFDEHAINPRASALFHVAGVGMFGGSVRGDALAVLGADERGYERSLPPEFISALMEA